METKTKTRKNAKINMISKNTNRLAMILGMGGLNGVVSIAALAGLFRIENAFANAVLFMAGPGAIITALTFEGEIRQRMLAALFAGVIATIIVVLAAGIGTRAIGLLNLNVLKITGGIAILAIGLIIMGVKINQNIPLVLIVLGILMSLIWRFGRW